MMAQMGVEHLVPQGHPLRGPRIVFEGLPEYPYECLFVDDGSTDGTREQLRLLALENPCIRPLHLVCNMGQSAALVAGMRSARGEYILTLDGDLQNDPSDFPQFLELLQDYDCVCGYRTDRQDTWLSRRLPSMLANWLIGRVTGVRLHDYGCSLKAYRAEIVKNVHLYGEMHRFIPALASWLGARTAEIPVHHHARLIFREGSPHMPGVHNATNHSCPHVPAVPSDCAASDRLQRSAQYAPRSRWRADSR